MRTSNPAMRAFESAGGAYGEQTMSVHGAIHKTAICLGILFFAALWVWNQVFTSSGIQAWVMGSAIIGFIIAIVTCFKPQWAPITAPLYAGFEGIFVGAISAIFEARYPGLVLQAVTLTFCTLGGMLFLYRSGIIRATPMFKKIIFTATAGIAVFYLINFIMSFFGSGIPVINSAGPFGIGFSLIVVGIAAFNLILDFDLIEHGAGNNAPKYMEWYSAFALTVTLVWLYLEILRLLSKLQRR